MNAITTRTFSACVAVALCTSVFVPASAAINGTDKSFVVKAAQGGMAEVAQAVMALQKSRNATVDAFAKQMRADHTTANAKLMAIVKSDGLTAPASIDPDQARLAAKLQKLSGNAFDSAYLRAQLPAHQQTLKLMQHEAVAGRDARLVAFAKATIPVVKTHIAMLMKDLTVTGALSGSM